MSSSSTPANPSALLYQDGQWVEMSHDPMDERFLLGLPVPEALERAGFELFTSVRHQDAAPLGMSLYRGPLTADPRWLVLLEAPPIHEGPQYSFVYARRLPDVMKLLAEWAPVVRDLATIELTAFRLLEDDDFDDSGQTGPDTADIIDTADTADTADIIDTAGIPAAADAGDERVNPDVARRTEDGPPPGASAAAGPDPLE